MRMTDYSSKLCTLLVIIFAISLLSFTATASQEAAWRKVDQEADLVEFEGLWGDSPYAKTYKYAYEEAEKVSYDEAASAEFEFTGTDVRVIGSKGPKRGKADIYIDGSKIETIDTYDSERKFQAVLFEESALGEGEHTIKVVPTGEKSEKAESALIAVDAFGYIPTLQGALEASKKALLQSKSPPEVGDPLLPYNKPEDRNPLIKVIAEALSLQEKGDMERDEAIDMIGELNSAMRNYEERVQKPVFPDLSGNGFTASPKLGPVWAKGKKGKAVSLDGEVQHLYVPTKLLEGETEVTIEAWIKPDDKEGSERIVANDDGNVYHLVKNPHAPEPGVALRVTDSAGSWQDYATGNPVKPEEWQHVAGVYNGEDEIIYQDGKETGRTTIGEMTLNEPGEISAIGANVGGGTIGGYEFGGEIDEIRVWNVARTQEEIRNNMKKDLTGDEEGLVAYWDFDEYKGE